MVWACRTAGARLADASAISLVAVYYCCVPNLNHGAILEDAILGLLWQEGAIASSHRFSLLFSCRLRQGCFAFGGGSCVYCDRPLVLSGLSGARDFFCHRHERALRG